MRLTMRQLDRRRFQRYCILDDEVVWGGIDSWSPKVSNAYMDVNGAMCAEERTAADAGGPIDRAFATPDLCRMLFIFENTNHDR